MVAQGVALGTRLPIMMTAFTRPAQMCRTLSFIAPSPNLSAVIPTQVLYVEYKGLITWADLTEDGYIVFEGEWFGAWVDAHQCATWRFGFSVATCTSACSGLRRRLGKGVQTLRVK